MVRSSKSRTNNKSSKSSKSRTNNKSSKSRTNNKAGCNKEISNPWYSVLSSELLKKPFLRSQKISDSQKKNWCNTVKKSKKQGYGCIKLGSDNHDLSKWNAVCN
jgi:hypothetical protein